jgi:hypothetical protein
MFANFTFQQPTRQSQEDSRPSPFSSRSPSPTLRGPHNDHLPTTQEHNPLAYPTSITDLTRHLTASTLSQTPRYTPDEGFFEASPPPSPTSPVADLRTVRAQRQSNTRLQLESSHLNGLADLVARMLAEEAQCNVRAAALVGGEVEGRASYPVVTRVSKPKFTRARSSGSVGTLKEIRGVKRGGVSK